MNSFVIQYRSFLLSTLVLVLGIVAMGYAALYRNLTNNIDELRTARASLTVENQLLEKRQKTIQTVKKSEATGSGISTMPVFLKRINTIASSNEVIVRQLTPTKESRFKFNMEIHTDYFTFLRFLAALESLNTVINDLEVRPYDSSKVPPIHVIKFSITPRNDAEPLSSERLSQLLDDVQRSNKRNPFQRFAFDASHSKPQAVIDLTWIYPLTGIGKREDRYYATINRRDYSVGDVLDNRVVTRINADRLYLEKVTRDGVQEYVLRFRDSQ